jgi:hypothetical protein
MISYMLRIPVSASKWSINIHFQLARKPRCLWSHFKNTNSLSSRAHRDVLLSCEFGTTIDLYVLFLVASSSIESVENSWFVNIYFVVA